eukprot:45471-Prymnesium_polylepis.1
MMIAIVAASVQTATFAVGMRDPRGASVSRAAIHMGGFAPSKAAKAAPAEPERYELPVGTQVCAAWVSRSSESWSTAQLPPRTSCFAVATQNSQNGHPRSQFMGAWRIDPQICDDIVRVFEANPQVQTKGMISMKGGGAPVIDKSVKDSLEMSFAPNDARPEWKAYLGALGKVTSVDPPRSWLVVMWASTFKPVACFARLYQVMGDYCKVYPMAAAYGVFGLMSRTNFQCATPQLAATYLARQLATQLTATYLARQLATQLAA